MSGTTVPAAITSLTTMFTAAVPTVEVTDGPNYEADRNHLCVGWHSNEEAAATVNYSIADAGRSRDQEDYDVACLLSFHVGTAKTDSVSTTRVALYDAFEDLCTALRANSTLDGSVTRARLSEHGYLPAIGEGGVTLSIRFNINIIAWK